MDNVIFMNSEILMCSKLDQVSRNPNEAVTVGADKINKK